MSKNNQVENGSKKCQETFIQNQIKLKLDFMSRINTIYK
jgi:hypothetical protein